jgi:hypothetical protein
MTLGLRPPNIASTDRPGSAGLLWAIRCTWTDGTKRISKVFDLDAVERTPEL